MIRSLRTGRRAVLGALVGALLAAAPLAARSLVVKRLDAELLVSRDGSLWVTEHITVQFIGEWHGILRTIPVEYPGPGGFNYSLHLRPLGAQDEAGRPLRVGLSRRRGGLLEIRIYVPGAVDATRVVTLRYRVANAIRYFQGYDELWWNVVGPEGDVAVQAAGARVYLPSNATGLRATAQEGPYGSREAARLDTAGGNFVYAENNRPLGLREGVTVDVAWDPGTVARPGPLARAGFFLSDNWGFAFPLLAFALLLGLWYRIGRDPRLRPIAPVYEPPEQLSSAEAGTLLDNRPDLRDITALLVELAVRGHLRIEEKVESHALGLITRREYVFHRTTDPADWGSLAPHQRRLLEALFRGGAARDVETSELVNHFYTELPSIRRSILDALVSRGYYLHRPDLVMQPVMVGGIIVGALIAIGGGKLAERMFGVAPLSFVVGGILTGLLAVVFARIMPARTASGSRALEKVLGFQEFLRRVEGDRLERVVRTPELFERCLPYAMAFGVESNWARAFDDIYREPPTWYVGTAGPFRASLFTADIGHMCGRAGSAMTASPRGSSGSSGFGGGGGFSGGGFGGGGVGGF